MTEDTAPPAKKWKVWTPRVLGCLYFGALLFAPSRTPMQMGDSCCVWPPPGEQIVQQGAPIDASAPAVSSSLPSTEEFSASSRQGYQGLTFAQLSGTELSLNDRGLCTDAKIPQSISALEGKQVALAGFVIPTLLEGDKMTEFLLVPNQLACCFGQPLQLNQWVEVKSAEPLDCVTDAPISVYGVFHAFPQSESSTVTGIYKLEAQGLSTATEKA